jgi:hypothetical protein
MGAGVGLKWELLKVADVRAEIGRVASLLVALACLLIAHLFGSREVLHLAITVVVLPLGCIWYGNEIGSFVGMSAHEEGGAGKIAGALITAAGWIALFAMLAIVVFFAFGRPQ